MVRRLRNPIGLLLGVGLMLAILGIGAQNFAQPGGPGSDSQCSALLQAALASTDAECSDTTRNQACYGHVLNLVSPRPDLIESLVFEAKGDKANLQDVASMELSPLDLAEERWGVVLMQVQASLPDSLPGQNVTFILFGDVQVENAVGTPVEIEADVLSAANIRVAPGDTRPLLGSLTQGNSVTANGKIMTAAGELWVRVNHDPEEEIYGWIRADLLDVALDGLPDVQASDQAINPMQAFYFKTGVGQPQCIEAPADGILIQTPKGVGKVDFKINGMDVALGSTGYLTAPNGENLSCLYLIEGDSDVEAMGDGVSVKPGERTCVELDKDGVASSAPSEPEPYDAEMVGLVVSVLELLPDEVELPDAQPTFTPTFTATRTTAPVVVPRGTATPTAIPSVTPTDFVFPSNTPATPSATPIQPCPAIPARPRPAPVPCKPTASFSYSISDKQVVFTNTSYGDVTRVEWDFGDGNTSTSFSPTHIYADYGCYTVRLQVFNAFAADRANASFELFDLSTPIPSITPVPPTATTPPTPPTANFTYSLDVFDFVYADSSVAGSGTITSWSWNFGDGTTGNSPSGLHTYAPGAYTIILTVTDVNGLSATQTMAISFTTCVFNPGITTSFAVNRDVADLSGTVYVVNLKASDCTSIPVQTLSISNPTFTGTIAKGQHYFIQQQSPCVAPPITGIAGTNPVTVVATNNCP